MAVREVSRSFKEDLPLKCLLAERFLPCKNCYFQFVGTLELSLFVSIAKLDDRDVSVIVWPHVGALQRGTNVGSPYTESSMNLNSA